MAEVIEWIVCGIIVLGVGGLGIVSLIYSFIEDRRRRKERRERANFRKAEG